MARRSGRNMGLAMGRDRKEWVLVGLLTLGTAAQAALVLRMIAGL